MLLHLRPVTGQVVGQSQAGLQFRWTDHGQERRADRVVNMRDGQALADRLAVALLAGAAEVGGARHAVVGPHPTAAASADDEALQQPRSWLGRAATGGELPAVVAQRGPVGLILGPGDVAGMVIAHEDLHLVQRPAPPWPAPPQAGQSCALLPALPVHVGPRVGRIAHHLMNGLVAGLHPDQRVGRRATPIAPGDAQPMLAEETQRRAGAPVLLKLGEDRAQRPLHLRVGVERHLPIGATDVADGQQQRQLPAARLAHPRAVQAGLDAVQLHFANGAAQAQQQAIVEVARIVDGVLIADQHPGQRRQFQQPIPFGRVAGQTRDLQGQDEPHLAQAHRGDHPREAITLVGRRAAGRTLALIRVDDRDLLGAPAQALGALGEAILAASALRVALHLCRAGLADIDEGALREMARGDLGIGRCPQRGRGARPGDTARGVVLNHGSLTASPQPVDDSGPAAARSGSSPAPGAGGPSPGSSPIEVTLRTLRWGPEAPRLRLVPVSGRRVCPAWLAAASCCFPSRDALASCRRRTSAARSRSAVKFKGVTAWSDGGEPSIVVPPALTLPEGPISGGHQEAGTYCRLPSGSSITHCRSPA